MSSQEGKKVREQVNKLKEREEQHETREKEFVCFAAGFPLLTHAAAVTAAALAQTLDPPYPSFHAPQGALEIRTFASYQSRL